MIESERIALLKQVIVNMNNELTTALGSQSNVMVEKYEKIILGTKIGEEYRPSFSDELNFGPVNQEVTE